MGSEWWDYGPRHPEFPAEPDPTERQVAGNCDTCANDINEDGHQSWCPENKESA